MFIFSCYLFIYFFIIVLQLAFGEAGFPCSRLQLVFGEAGFLCSELNWPFGKLIFFVVNNCWLLGKLVFFVVLLALLEQWQWKLVFFVVLLAVTAREAGFLCSSVGHWGSWFSL